MSSIFACASRLFAGLCILSLASVAKAAPCGRPDVDLTFPPNNAAAVPPNAQFAAHYASPALYANEPVSLLDPTGNTVGVTVTYDDADSMLRATPDQALAPGAHQVTWPGLRGASGSGGVGRGSVTSFVVGNVADAAAPVFQGLVGIDWDLSRDRDPCLDRLDDRFVFKLQVGQASDDSGTSPLALMVFETADPASAAAEPSKVGVRAWPVDGSIEVRRPANQAGRTCFAAVTQDLLGKVSGGGEREVCVSTRKPPFFEGCAVVAGGANRPQVGVGYVFLLLGLAWLGRGRTANARAPRAA